MRETAWLAVELARLESATSWISIQVLGMRAQTGLNVGCVRVQNGYVSLGTAG